jgi:hypothetical protein
MVDSIPIGATVRRDPLSFSHFVPLSLFHPVPLEIILAASNDHKILDAIPIGAIARRGYLDPQLTSAEPG